MRKTSTVRHLLVIRLSAMGDVAIVPTVLLPFIEKYPKVKVTVLSRPLLKPIFEGLPDTDFHEADIYGKHKGFLGLYKLAKELHSLKIDAVADLHGVLRTKVLVFFLNLKGIVVKSIDKGRAEKRALTRIRNKTFKQLKTTRERYADVFRALGFDITMNDRNILPKRPFPKGDFPLGGKNIGIAPFAAYPAKTYPLEKTEEVIQQLLSKRNDLRILLFGDKKHFLPLSDLQEKYTNVHNIAGKYTFREELNILSNLDVMLSMDSANAHLAAMFGVPVVTLWGVTHPYAGFEAIGTCNTNLIPDRQKYPLIPTCVYGNKCPEGYNTAIASISPKTISDTVLEKIFSYV